MIDPTASPEVLMAYLAGAAFLLAGAALYMGTRARLDLNSMRADFQKHETVTTERFRKVQAAFNVKRRAVAR